MWVLLASLFVGMVVLLILHLPFAPLWARSLQIPKPYLCAGIAVLACFRVYASTGSLVDQVLLLGLGLLGFLVRRYDFRLAPALIAVILGPLAESSLREAMNNSESNPLTLISTPITITLYLLLALAIGWSLVTRVRSRQGADL